MIFWILLSQLSWGAADSVAVFHRPEKVVVLINERGANSRLQNLMNAFGPGDLLWQNADESLRFNCGRNQTAATCTIRLLPSNSVAIGEKEALAEAAGPSALQDFSTSFESSRGQSIEIKIQDGKIGVRTRKR